MHDIKIDGKGHFIINHVNVTETLHQIAEYNDWPSRVERLACKILTALDPRELRNAVLKIESIRIDGVGGGGGAVWVGSTDLDYDAQTKADSAHAEEVVRLRAELAELKTAAKRVVEEAEEKELTWSLLTFIDDLEELC